MPELPEIASRAREMRSAVLGRTISSVDVLQEKSLNVPVEAFQEAIVGARLLAVRARGKWLQVQTTQGYLMINLGMGGEVLLTTPDTIPEKHRLLLHFRDGELLVINFWWVGYAHWVTLDGLEGHRMTASLGPNALELDAEGLEELLLGRRGGIKSFLLKQSNIAGIGNFYIHDILFRAGLHPLRTIPTIGKGAIVRLAAAISEGLAPSLELGGAWYEKRLDGTPGGFQREALLVAYREGEPCLTCGAPIIKLKTGSTSGFICPRCQPL